MTTLNLQVGAAADDVTHRTTTSHFFSATGTSLLIGNYNGSIKGYGMSARFTSVTIGQGDTIDLATMTFTTALGDSGEVCKAVIDAEDEDTGTAPTTDADWDNETKTTAAVAWDPIPAWPTVDAEHVTPEIKTVIQELVDRGSWASGNAMNLFLHDEALGSDASSRRWVVAYESNSAKAAKLDITFTAGGGGGGAIVSRRLLSGTGR